MTQRRAFAILASLGLAAAAAASLEPAVRAARGAQDSGWQLPPDSEEKTNPHPVDQELLAVGRAVFKDKCARCHGPGGLGDGPDANPDAQENMDLTNPKRAEGNPDGVVFYKVWNGRRRPRMPAFSAELSEHQVWAVVAYVQSLKRQ